ncbi:hypothetical protein CC78DRAFT_157548 [Lojkania enalia]|uniref:Uncharacterized protein n=1 Tax=Lojkania enalia TaxID=147567 RepID=A0A9P4JX27_9PLEO|nr:hypothetical protein CC78DRAFT_157548 [Didymosphaeria enalia]
MENGSEAQDQPKAPKDRNKSEDASQAPLAPSPTRSGKLSQNSSSKFLAEPLLPISKAKPSPFTTSQTQSAVTLSMKRSSTSAVSPQPNQKSVEPQIATKWEYDVYARPYIPSAFRAANHEPGHVVFTEAKHKVNFEEYTNTFVGKAFIPKRIAMPTHDNAQIQADGMLLTEASYLEYFLSLWKIELEAKKRENESFALYKVPILPLPMPDGQDLYALSIPGLREDSPFVEIGDTIQLRQLWLDSAGNLMGVPVMMPGPGNPYQHSPVVLSWGTYSIH